MRDRIVFFILGAILATVAYFAGDMDKATAEDDGKFFEGDVSIQGKLIVGGGYILVANDTESVTDSGDLINAISIHVSDKGSTISVINGIDSGPAGENASHILMSARKMDAGKRTAFISFNGDYGKDSWSLKSTDDLSK